MPLNQDQDEELRKYMIGQNDPHGTMVESPTPPIEAQPDQQEGSRDARIKDSNPGHTPMDLSGNMASRATSLDQYGPDQEKAVYDNIMKERGSFGNRAARFGASLGDSLMSVAGKQPTGFLNSLENREKGQNEMDLNRVPMLGRMNMQNMAAHENLEEKDANSALSKAAQGAYEGIFRKMGYPPGSTANKSVAELRTIAALAAQVHGSELEDAVKAAELKLNASRIDAQIQNDTAKTNLDKEKSEQDALKTLSGMTWYNRLLHPGVSGKLSEQAGLSGEKTPSEGPYGATTTRGGKTYIWSPSSGKYHLK